MARIRSKRATNVSKSEDNSRSMNRSLRLSVLRSSSPAPRQYVPKGGPGLVVSSLPPSSPIPSSPRVACSDLDPGYNVLQGFQTATGFDDANDPFGFLTAERKL